MKTTSIFFPYVFNVLYSYANVGVNFRQGGHQWALKYKPTKSSLFKDSKDLEVPSLETILAPSKNFNPDCYYNFYNSFNSSSFYLAAASSASLVQGNPFSKFS